MEYTKKQLDSFLNESYSRASLLNYKNELNAIKKYYMPFLVKGFNEIYDKWIKELNTPPEIPFCVEQYVKGRLKNHVASIVFANKHTASKLRGRSLNYVVEDDPAFEAVSFGQLLAKERSNYYKNNPQAWCADFIKNVNNKNMNKEKKPIGYKLKSGCKAYIPAIEVICTISDFKKLEELQMPRKGFVFEFNSINFQRANEAGVLDLWFEPVYAIDITTKIFTLASDKIEVVITNKKSIKIKDEFLPIELLETIHSIRHAHFYQPRANKHYSIDVVSAKFKVNNYYMSLIEVKAIMDIYAELNGYKYEH